MNLLKIQTILADQKTILADLLARRTCGRLEEQDIDLGSELDEVLAA